MQARKRLSEILTDIISERKEKRLLDKDLLGFLLNSKDENGEVLKLEQVADNIIGVLFAAQDTTASVMTWTLKYLHDNPKLLDAVKVPGHVRISIFHYFLLGQSGIAYDSRFSSVIPLLSG